MPLLSSCNWFKTTPEVGVILSEHFKNKLYKEFDTAAYNVVFNRHLDSLRSKLSNPKVIGSFYANNDRKNLLVTRFYANGELDTLKNYLENSKVHGFNPEIFRYKELAQLLSVLSDNKFNTISEVYPVLADLELYAASSLLKYDTLLVMAVLIQKSTQ